MSFIPSASIFRHQAYRRYWIMRQFVSAARQMTAVAIGWHVYELARETRSIEEAAFVLGGIGLAQFLPVFLLSLIGGQAADRYDRKKILMISGVLRSLLLICLSMTAYMATATALPTIFVIAASMGILNAFSPAASNALYPKLVPREELTQAIAWNSLGFQAFAIMGPAVGGMLYVIGDAALVYRCAAGLTVCAVIAIWGAKTPTHIPLKNVRGLSMMIEGLRYVRSNKIVLGAISLDLVVVLFGGATALLPIFARDILGVGEQGFGLLRASPAIGAVIIAVLLATRPLARRVGFWMLIAIAVYGFALIGFAFSKIFVLSMMMLAITGAADMISVYVRQSLIQLATPDAMRGRVGSVSSMFISASNELGEFESGVAARFLGPVGAVLLGGTIAVGCSLAWLRLFPDMARADRFDDASVR